MSNINNGLYNTQNSKALKSFTDYCRANPSQRFWQALRNWSGFAFIKGVYADGTEHDTFYDAGGQCKTAAEETHSGSIHT